MKFKISGGSEYSFPKRITWRNKASFTACDMPLTNIFDVDIPPRLSSDVEAFKKTVLKEPINVTFSAGTYSTNPLNKGSINFTKDSIESLKIDSATCNFESEDVSKLPVFGKALAKYLTKKGFEDVTYSRGNITVTEDGEICISAFQLQDAHAIGSNKYVYTRINCSKDINLNNFKNHLDYCIEEYGKDATIAMAIVVGIVITLVVVTGGLGGMIPALAPVYDEALVAIADAL
ncbi:MAG: hypothetical protein LKJ75_03980 [Clostridia bacterium]|nr:hypothetical protein [Clostridia bacterium]MCI2014342.1 hypothetical protein [Clostridia bacterium]